MMQMNKSKYILTIIVSVILGSFLAVGIVIAGLKINGLSLVSSETAELVESLSKNFNKMPDIHKTIIEEGIFTLDEKKASDNVYKALVKSLGDPYSEYLTEKEVKEWEESLSGEFSGVGINFHKKDGRLVVIKTIEGSPASNADIKPGDFILKADGKAYEESDEMARHIRGPEGTKVVVTFERDGVQKDIELTRAKVKEHTVNTKELSPTMGYIQITGFEDGTAKEFDKALGEFQTKGYTSMVIDLRGNAGGYTSEGIEIADKLLPEGTITYMENKKGEKEYYNSDVKQTKIKYALLVDENTASTSEILAAAIKDNKGGPIVGTRTYGKGIVQTTFKFSDGSALKLTILQYFSPKGKTIHKKGVNPDYVVEYVNDSEQDVQLEKAMEVLK